MRELTRRGFAIGLLGAGSLARRAWGALFPPSVFGGILVGVQSYTFRDQTLDQMIASMVSIGISSVELWHGHLHPLKHTEADFKAARKKLADAGITVSAYCANFDRNDVPDDHLDRAFAGAGLLGTSVLTTSCEKPIVSRLDERARKYKVKVGLHNHWLGDSWFKGNRALNFETPADWAEALKDCSEWMAINLDVGHFAAAGQDPVAFFKENHRRIVSLHVKDRAADKEHNFVRFGKGATPLLAFAKVLRQTGFPYAANLELEIEEKDPREGLREDFAYFTKALA